MKINAFSGAHFNTQNNLKSRNQSFGSLVFTDEFKEKFINDCYDDFEIMDVAVLGNKAINLKEQCNYNTSKYKHILSKLFEVMPPEEVENLTVKFNGVSEQKSDGSGSIELMAKLPVYDKKSNTIEYKEVNIGPTIAPCPNWKYPDDVKGYGFSSVFHTGLYYPKPKLLNTIDNCIGRHFRETVNQIEESGSFDKIFGPELENVEKQDRRQRLLALFA